MTKVACLVSDADKAKVIAMLSKVLDKGVFDYMQVNGDFDSAPASVRYHGAWRGGLSDHSFNVMYILTKLSKNNHVKWDRPESPYIIGFLHDLCKVNFYKISSHNVKDPDTGKWVTEPWYSVEEKDCLGHGEKSVILAQELGAKLTMQEIYCIRWHMGAFDLNKQEQGWFSNSCEKHPEILFVNVADFLAGTYEDGVDISSYIVDNVGGKI